MPGGVPGSEVLDFFLCCAHSERRIAAALGLSLEELHCLGQLFAHEPCCVKALNELLDASGSRTSRLLGGLEDRGLLVRSLDAADHRREHVTLTDFGCAAMERATALYLDTWNDLVARGSFGREQTRSDAIGDGASTVGFESERP
jgi:DNA-binding MarR family transcriptional regulator